MSTTNSRSLLSQLSHPLFIPALIAVFYFILNLPLTSPVNVGYADSDELLAVAYNRGISHPPGYPLYSWLLGLFVHLPLNAPSVAYLGHIFSLIAASLTLAVVFRALFHFYPLIKPAVRHHRTIISKPFERIYFALIPTATLAFTYQFWLYSHITEKYAFACLLTALVLHQLITISSTSKPVPRQWYLLAVFFGLSLSHLQSLVLLGIPILVLLWIKKKLDPDRFTFTFSAIALITFALPYLLLFLIARSNPTVSWQIDLTLPGIWDFITRRDFSGLRYASGLEVGAYLDSFDIDKFYRGASAYLINLFRHSGWWNLPVLALSLAFISKRLGRYYLVFLSAALSLGILFLGYIGMPQDLGSQAITLRQYLPGFVLLTPLVYLGWHELLKRFTASLSVLIASPKPIFLILLIPILPLSLHAYHFLPRVDLSGYTLISRRYQHILNQLEPDAVLTCFSDISCFALIYEQYVNQLRSDVTLVPMAYPLITDVVNHPQLRGFHSTYVNNPYLTIDIITWNLDTRPVYAVELSDLYFNLLGISGGYIYYLPLGSYGQLTYSLPDALPSIQDDLVDEWLSYPAPSIDPMRTFHKSAVGRDHLLNGTMYIKMDRRDWSLQQFNLASNIFHQFGARDRADITALRNELEQYQPEPGFTPGSSVLTVPELIEPVDQLLENNLIRRAFTLVHAAMLRDPRDPDVRVQLGSIYLLLGDPDFALIEYNNALILDPDHPQALEQLQKLSAFPDLN